MNIKPTLSFHKDLTNQNPTITNNISIRSDSGATIQATGDGGEFNLQYPPPPTVQQAPPMPQDLNSDQIQTENEFLKHVLHIYMNQPFYFKNKHILLSTDEMLDLLHVLLPQYEINIRLAEEEETGCCGAVRDKLNIVKIDSIWLNRGEEAVNFKYAFSNLVSLFNQYNISTKYIRAA